MNQKDHRQLHEQQLSVEERQEVMQALKAAVRWHRSLCAQSEKARLLTFLKTLEARKRNDALSLQAAIQALATGNPFFQQAKKYRQAK